MAAMTGSRCRWAGSIFSVTLIDSQGLLPGPNARYLNAVMSLRLLWRLRWENPDRSDAADAREPQMLQSIMLLLSTMEYRRNDKNHYFPNAAKRRRSRLNLDWTRGSHSIGHRATTRRIDDCQSDRRPRV